MEEKSSLGRLVFFSFIDAGSSLLPALFFFSFICFFLNSITQVGNHNHFPPDHFQAAMMTLGLANRKVGFT